MTALLVTCSRSGHTPKTTQFRQTSPTVESEVAQRRRVDPGGPAVVIVIPRAVGAPVTQTKRSPGTSRIPGLLERPQRDLNPRYRRERPASWAN